MSHDNISAEIDRQAYTNALAKTSPITKIFFCFSALILSVSSPSPVIPVIIFLVNLFLLFFVAKVSTRFFFHLLEYPFFALTLSVIIIALFFGSGAVLTQLSTSWFTWNIYTSGITMAIATFLRVIGAISSTFLLVLTTSMTDIFITLRKIKVPKVLIEISLLIYRYIFVFMEVSSKMNTAQKLRQGHSSVMRRLRSLALLAGNLFIRTLEQGERTFTAMNSRGYDGDIRILDELPRPRKTVLGTIMIFDIFMVILIILLINFGVVLS
jgi:cobalt/nickel transport system permease protein